MVIAIVLFTTKFFGLCFRKMHLPEVLGFIIAGILIGPAIFGRFCHVTLIGFEDDVQSGLYNALFSLEVNAAGENETVSVFSKIGVILIMFSAGLETNLDDIKNTGLASFLLATAGVVVPFVLGFVISLPFGDIGLGAAHIYRCVFIGAILTATSVAITVSVLKELGKINTKLGTTIVSAAVIDDVIGIVVLSVVTSIARSGGGDAANGFDAFKSTIYGTIIMIIAFFIVALVVGFGISKLFKWMEKKWYPTHRLSIFSLVVCFLYSWVAEEIFGVADITGAYVAGLVLGGTLQETPYVENKADMLGYMIFSPIFFANIGIQYFDFSSFGGIWLAFGLAYVAAAVLGKFIGCGAGGLLCKFSVRDSAQIGAGMMVRAEVVLVCAKTGLDSGLVSQSVMTYICVIIIFTSFLVPVLLKVLMPKEPSFTDAAQ